MNIGTLTPGLPLPEAPAPEHQAGRHAKERSFAPFVDQALAPHREQPQPGQGQRPPSRDALRHDQDELDQHHAPAARRSHRRPICPETTGNTHPDNPMPTAQTAAAAPAALEAAALEGQAGRQVAANPTAPPACSAVAAAVAVTLPARTTPADLPSATQPTAAPTAVTLTPAGAPTPPPTAPTWGQASTSSSPAGGLSSASASPTQAWPPSAPVVAGAALPSAWPASPEAPAATHQQPTAPAGTAGVTVGATAPVAAAGAAGSFPLPAATGQAGQSTPDWPIAQHPVAPSAAWSSANAPSDPAGQQPTPTSWTAQPTSPVVSAQPGQAPLAATVPPVLSAATPAAQRPVAPALTASQQTPLTETTTAAPTELPSPSTPASAPAATQSTALPATWAPAASLVPVPIAPAAIPQVAATPPASPVIAPPPAQQLSHHLAALRTGPDGVHRMSVTLRPDELGPVHLRVEVREGVLTIAMTGASELARETLRAALPELRRELTQAGVSTGAMEVRNDLNPSHQQARRDPDTSSMSGWGQGQQRGSSSAEHSDRQGRTGRGGAQQSASLPGQRSSDSSTALDLTL